MSSLAAPKPDHRRHHHRHSALENHVVQALGIAPRQVKEIRGIAPVWG
jgi:hypothetical protein